MSLIDFDYLDGLDKKGFRATQPYPWLGIKGALTDSGFDTLTNNMPDVAGFRKFFGKQRGHGQKPHNRYTLEYSRDIEIPEPWVKFIEELEGPRYRKWMTGMLGTPFFLLSYHWHYTPAGCSVSPHCDSRRKLGSHIFYLNKQNEWKDEWGGQTIVLDDNGRFSTKSAPDFDEFDSQQSAETLGNRSFLFRRRGNSWHGVKEISCPEDQMRKVFIVVINANDPIRRFKRWVKRKPPPGY